MHNDVIAGMFCGACFISLRGYTFVGVCELILAGMRIVIQSFGCVQQYKLVKCDGSLQQYIPAVL